MRFLITGAGGQLGTDLTTHCTQLGDHVTALTRNALDIADHTAVHDAVTATRPDVIVNCAAWTAVDDCETDPDRADRINGHAVTHLTQAAQSAGAHLIQISTDYVFDGTKPDPYTETDPTNPKSAYGKSKLLGEQAAGPDATIVRTSWVCSAHDNNMVATLTRLEQTHKTLTFVNDQTGRPTFTPDLAAAIHNLATDRAPGTWHIANHGPVTWYQFAQTVFTHLGADPNRIQPITTNQLHPPRPAPRPTNSTLNTTKYDHAYEALPHFSESLARAV